MHLFNIILWCINVLENEVANNGSDVGNDDIDNSYDKDEKSNTFVHTKAHTHTTKQKIHTIKIAVVFMTDIITYTSEQ